MRRKTETKADRSSPSNFLTFWTTLPGILTGVAGLLTAIAGLYIAFGPAHIPPNPRPTPSPTPQFRSANCFEEEFAAVTPVEVGSGEQGLTSKDGVIRIKLTDNHVPVGALRLKFHSVGGYFEIEETLDSHCAPVENLYNISRQTPVDANNKPKNDDTLKIRFGSQDYSLRLSFHGNFSANFIRL